MTKSEFSSLPCVVLCSTDLMLISSVGGAAEASGFEFVSVNSLQVAIDKASALGSIVCLDLAASFSDPHEFAAAASLELLVRSIAFGPHVHTARLDAARAAGIGRVMSRGQFVSGLATHFGSFAK
ncbi:MAG: hypothetical protein WKF77_24610 [Planctomycetaceae bacterium]